MPTDYALVRVAPDSTEHSEALWDARIAHLPIHSELAPLHRSVWASSGIGGSPLATDIELRIVYALACPAISRPYESLWELVLGSSDDIDGSIDEVEHDLLLVGQPPKNVRTLVGVVHRQERVWRGLALSEDEVATIHAEPGDA